MAGLPRLQKFLGGRTERGSAVLARALVLVLATCLLVASPGGAGPALAANDPSLKHLDLSQVGLRGSDEPMVKAHALPSTADTPKQLPSEPLRDSFAEVPKGSAELDVASSWDEAASIPVEVRDSSKVTTLPEGPDELATTAPVPSAEAAPDVVAESPVEVSVKPSGKDYTPGLVVKVDPTAPPAIPKTTSPRGSRLAARRPLTRSLLHLPRRHSPMSPPRRRRPPSHLPKVRPVVRM
jgi:hypothetical protein